MSLKKMNIKEKNNLLNYLNGLKTKKATSNHPKSDQAAIRYLLAGKINEFDQYIKDKNNFYHKKESIAFFIKKKKRVFNSINKNNLEIIKRVLLFKVPYLDIELFLYAVDHKKPEIIKTIVEFGFYSNWEDFFFEEKNNKFYAVLKLNEFSIPIFAKIKILKDLFNNNFNRTINNNTVADNYFWLAPKQNILFSLIDENPIIDLNCIDLAIKELEIDINKVDINGNTIGLLLIKNLFNNIAYNLNSFYPNNYRLNSKIIEKIITLLVLGANPSISDNKKQSINSVFDEMESKLKEYDLNLITLLKTLIKQKPTTINHDYDLNNFYQEIKKYKKSDNHLAIDLGICLFANQKKFLENKNFNQDDFSCLPDSWLEKIIKENLFSPQLLFRLLKNNSINQILNGDRDFNLYTKHQDLKKIFLFNGNNFWFYHDLSKINEVLKFSPININKQNNDGNTALTYNFLKLLNEQTGEHDIVLTNIIILLKNKSDFLIKNQQEESFYSLYQKHYQEDWFPREIINHLEKRIIEDSIKLPSMDSQVNKI